MKWDRNIMNGDYLSEFGSKTHWVYAEFLGYEEKYGAKIGKGMKNWE